jgi:hypothetical protein
MSTHDKSRIPAKDDSRAIANNLPVQRHAVNAIQRKIAATTFKSLIREQMALSEKMGAGGKKPQQEIGEEPLNQHTTVGFEFEFASMGGSNPLKGASHVEISSSEQTINGLPFNLETDASDALELVTPPLWIETLPGQPIPLPEEVKKVDDLAKERLRILTGEVEELRPELKSEEPVEKEDQDQEATVITMAKLISDFHENPGLDFSLKAIKIEAKNLSKRTEKDYNRANNNVSKEDIAAIEISKIKKWKKGIDTQINIATNAEAFIALEQIVRKYEKPWEETERYDNLYKYLTDNALPVLAPLKKGSGSGLDTFAQVVIRYFSGLPAVPYSLWLRQQLDFLYNTAGAIREARKSSIQGTPKEATGKSTMPGAPEDNSPAISKFYGTAATTSSHVKDVHQVWLKDTLMNVGLGLLKKEDWAIVKEWMTQLDGQKTLLKYDAPMSLYQSKVENLDGSTYLGALNKNEVARMKDMNKAVQELLGSASKQVIADIESFKLDKTDQENVFLGPLHQQEFLKHDKRWIGPRQDTYIDAPLVSLPAMWPGMRLHVVELRMDNIVETLERLAKDPPKATGKETLAAPPMRLMTQADWTRETGFTTPDSINQLFNRYAHSVNDPMAGQYTVIQTTQFPAAALKNFIKWLHEQHLILSDWAEEFNLSLPYLQYTKKQYMTLYPAMEELTFYEDHKNEFHRFLQEFDLTRPQGPDQVGQLWTDIISCVREKGTPPENMTKQHLAQWQKEKQEARQKALAANNPWKRDK